MNFGWILWTPDFIWGGALGPGKPLSPATARLAVRFVVTGQS